MFVKSPLRIVFLLLFLTPALLPAQGPPAKPGEQRRRRRRRSRPSCPRRSRRRPGTPSPSTARRSTTRRPPANYLMKDEDGTPKASIFYVAYTRDGMKDPADRPVTFSFNGGPGAAAVWVHFGAFGPTSRRADRRGHGHCRRPAAWSTTSRRSSTSPTSSSSIPCPPATAARCRAWTPSSSTASSRTSSPWASSSACGSPATSAGPAPSSWPARATAPPARPASPSSSRRASAWT